VHRSEPLLKAGKLLPAESVERKGSPVKNSKTESMILAKIAKQGYFSCDSSEGVRVEKAVLNLVKKGQVEVVKKECYRYEQPHSIGNYKWISHHTGLYIKVVASKKG
jgi:hypothetical protein